MYLIIFPATGAIYIFIVNASPNRASLGATNGLSQVNILLLHSVMTVFNPPCRWRSVSCEPSDRLWQTHYSRSPWTRDTWVDTSYTISSSSLSLSLLLLPPCSLANFGPTNRHPLSVRASWSFHNIHIHWHNSHEVHKPLHIFLEHSHIHVVCACNDIYIEIVLVPHRNHKAKSRWCLNSRNVIPPSASHML